MTHPEFSKKPEQEPASPEALADLRTSVGRVIEEMPEGVATNENTDPSVFFGWKNNLPIFNAQPVVTHRVDGEFITSFAPGAAEVLQINDADELELVYAPPCYEAGAANEESYPVDSYVGLTVSRPNKVVEADIYTIEVDATDVSRIQEATHTQQMSDILDGLDRDEAKSTAPEADKDEVARSIFRLSMQQDEQRTTAIDQADCAALAEIINQMHPDLG